MSRIKNFFSRFFGSSVPLNVTSVASTSGSNIVAQLTTLLHEKTKFLEMSDSEVFEQLARLEPEIGGAIDRFSTLVAASYKGITASVGKTLDPEEEEALRLAQRVAKAINIPRWFEIIAELLLIHGNVFIKVDYAKNDFIPILTILPNKKVTVVDKRENVGNIPSYVITDPQFVVIDEGEGNQRIYRYGHDVIHIKFKDTPYYVKDRLGRETYGIYSPSPLERAVFPVLWKREIMMIDASWRWRNVPREHHVIDSEMFNLSLYSGSLSERRLAAKRDAESTISDYMESIKDKQPDQAYVTTDTVDIKVVEPKSSRYMSPNDLMDQISAYLLMALGVPESVVSGRSRGSYASELVVSSYLTAKVIQTAKKIKDVFMPIIRYSVSRLSSKVPINILDMKIELILDTSRMEQFRQAAIMSSLGTFTPTEIRQYLGYEPLTEGQINEIIMFKSALEESKRGRTVGEKTIADIVKDTMQTVQPFDYPDTPHSKEARKSAGGDRE